MDHSQWKAIVMDQVDKAETVAEEHLPATIKVYAKDHKKQTTRLLKAMCPTCGYTIRVTQKWADKGLPICQECMEEFKVDGEEDEIQ